ncbi:MAG: hypothetical protein ACFE7R_04915, partial [Candidatus Hodarchaeota archaeon]
MKNKKFLLVVLCLFIILAVQPAAFALDMTRDGLTPAEYEPPIIEETELLTDPLLDENQTVTQFGASSNFSWSHDLGADDSPFNYLTLLWNHTAGAPLDFVDDPSENPDMPECNDFIVWEQSFPWTLQALPEAVQINFSARTDTEGELHYPFIHCYVWLIDPTNDWVLITRYSVYSDT